MAFLTKIFGKNLTAGYDSLRMGLKALFEHIQSECRQCAEDFASGEATQRWHEYEREFVERMNNQRAIEIMSEVAAINAGCQNDIHLVGEDGHFCAEKNRELLLRFQKAPAVDAKVLLLGQV